MLDPQVGKSAVGSRTFAAVRELLGYNCSPVCGGPTQGLLGGADGDLLHEDACHTPRLPGAMLPVAHACGRPLLTRASTESPQTQAGLAQLLWGHCSFPWVLVCTGFLVCALLESLVGLKFDFERDCAPPTVLLGLLLCPWSCGVFLVGCHILPSAEN